MTHIDFDPSTRNPRDFGYLDGRFASLAPTTLPRGIDISHWVTDNILDWAQVAPEITFNYGKATDGLTFVDTASLETTLAGRVAGIISLYYHLLRRSLSGSAQFDFFKAQAEPFILEIGGKKIIIVDYETSDGVNNGVGNANFMLLCDAAHNSGYLVWLYINPAGWSNYGMGAWVNAYVDGYIVAHWKGSNSPSVLLGMDQEKVMIQQEGIWDTYTWCEPVPGAVPQLDCNLLLWSLQDFESVTGQHYGTEPPAPPEIIKEINTTVVATHKLLKNVLVYHGGNSADWTFGLSAYNPETPENPTGLVEVFPTPKVNGRVHIAAIHPRGGVVFGWIPGSASTLEKLPEPVTVRAVGYDRAGWQG